MIDRRNKPVEDLIRSLLQIEEEFTDQCFSHFKLCIAVHFKSLHEKICTKLFHVAEKKCTMPFDEKLTFDLTKILLLKHLILKYCFIAKVMHYQILFTEFKSSC